MKNINQTFQYLLTIFPHSLGIISSWAIFLMIVLTGICSMIICIAAYFGKFRHDLTGF